MYVHSVIRWCFERQPRWAPEKSPGGHLGAFAEQECKDLLAERPASPSRPLRADGLFSLDTALRAPAPSDPQARQLSPPPPSYLPRAELPEDDACSILTTASEIPRPRWMLTPALLGLDSWALLSTFDEHHYGQGDLLTNSVYQPLSPNFFVNMQVVGDHAAAQNLACALWGPKTPGLNYFRKLALQQPTDLVSKVDRAARRAGIFLAEDRVHLAAGLLQLNGLEVGRRELHHQLMMQAQNCAFGVSTLFDAPARQQAHQLLARTDLQRFANHFVAPAEAPLDGRLDVPLSAGQALNEFTKLVEHFSYWHWRERIPPSERTERIERTPHTFYTPTTRYGDHLRDALLEDKDSRPPAALLPPRYTL